MALICWYVIFLADMLLKFRLSLNPLQFVLNINQDNFNICNCQVFYPGMQ